MFIFLPIKKSEKYKENIKTHMYPPSQMLPILYPVTPDTASIMNVGVCLLHFVFTTYV